MLISEIIRQLLRAQPCGFPIRNPDLGGVSPCRAIRPAVFGQAGVEGADCSHVTVCVAEEDFQGAFSDRHGIPARLGC